MIAKSYILANLKGLEKKFKTSPPKDALYFSKLAILELCGWIEESMDDVVIRCAKAHLKDAANLKYIEGDVVKRTYAFDYEKFRFMLIRLVGLVNVERIESKMDAVLKLKFASTLDALKRARDSEAHTHIKGVARVINAPSITIAQFQDVYAGLKEVEKLVKAAKL